MAPSVKTLPASAGDIGDMGLNPGLGRSPGGENGNPLQCSCLENPRDKGAWWASIHGVTKSQTGLSTAHSYSCVYHPEPCLIHSSTQYMCTMLAGLQVTKQETVAETTESSLKIEDWK